MEIFGIKLTEYGPEALCALFIILMFIGYIIPRRDRDYWRSSALKSADQVDKLIESIEPMVTFIKAFQEQSKRAIQKDDEPPQGGGL